MWREGQGVRRRHASERLCWTCTCSRIDQMNMPGGWRLSSEIRPTQPALGSSSDIICRKHTRTRFSSQNMFSFTTLFSLPADHGSVSDKRQPACNMFSSMSAVRWARRYATKSFPCSPLLSSKSTNTKWNKWKTTIRPLLSYFIIHLLYTVRDNPHYRATLKW